MRRIWWAVALVAACGDDDGSGELSSSKKLGELSEAELTSVCADVDARYLDFEKAVVSVSCTQQGRADASTCTAVRQQCVDSTNPADALAGTVKFECKGTTGSVASSCAQITVAELDACVDAIAASVETLATNYTCTADESVLQPPAAPANCTSLGERCPMFADFNVN